MGIYSSAWQSIYTKYMAVQDKSTPKPFALAQLNNEIREEDDQLYTNLKYLEEYYSKIQVFFMVAHTARQQPHDMDVQQTVAKAEDELSSRDTLDTYLYATIGALRALASIAKEIRTYIMSISSRSSSSSSSSMPSDEEIGLLTALLNEVKSISKNVRADFFAEVKAPPVPGPANVDCWNDYFSTRREFSGRPPATSRTV